jgi:hypothetical protein
MPNFNIYQIHYQDSQKKMLDSAFVPFDNSEARFPYNYEFGVILKSYENPIANDELRGFLSWKFTEKTGLNGQRFKKFIADNPGYDVYFINPFPSSAFYKSIWSQGDFYHPELTKFAQNVFTKAGYNVDLKQLRSAPSSVLFCNFWVGNKKFWDQFMAFSKPLWQYFETHASAEEKQMYASEADVLSKAPYSAYLFERMFSTFLAYKLASDEESSRLRALSYSYSLAELSQKYHLTVALIIWLCDRLARSPLKFVLLLLNPLIGTYLFVHRLSFKFFKSRSKNTGNAQA